MQPGPSCGDFTADHRREAPTDHRCAHIDMNNEAADGREGNTHVHRDRGVAQPAQFSRDQVNQPQAQTRKHEQDGSVKHQPEE